MSTEISKFLADPKPGITLDDLAKELNELAKIRDSARLAFCNRLALVYLMVVGHPPTKGRGARLFYDWCAQKIRSANGKQYMAHTLQTYVTVGFAKNPEKYLREKTRTSVESAANNRVLGMAVKRAVITEEPPKVIPITKLKAQGMPTDVAREVNALMTAWEQASSQARSQFMYIVTGKRIAA